MITRAIPYVDADGRLNQAGYDALSGMDRQAAALSASLSALGGSLPKPLGWAVYNDTTGAQSLSASTPAVFTVNAGTKIETYKPADVTAFWASNKITGREGDAIVVKIQCLFTPVDAAASYVDFTVDIGGAIGVTEAHSFPITKGAGVAHYLYWTFLSYTLDTWEANGGTVNVVSDGAGSLTNKRIMVARIFGA